MNRILPLHQLVAKIKPRIEMEV